jgi:hypothetical protein
MGLSEISSAGLLSIAALCAIRSRDRHIHLAAAAGVLATLAFYTRLNNLIMAFGVALFALSLRLPMRAAMRPATWRAGRSPGAGWRRVSWRPALVIPVVIGCGVLGFAWRTWHYTGVFSVFHGTQRHLLSNWEPGMRLWDSMRLVGRNVLMVLTVNDPPRFDLAALPVMAGALVAGLSVVGVPRFGDLPAAAVLFFFASIAGSIVARGSAYPGRFSIHVMPITCALTMCALSRVMDRTRVRNLGEAPAEPAGNPSTE